MSLICREFGIDNYLKVKIDGTDTFQGRLVKGPKTNQYGRLVGTLPSTFQLPASSIRDLLIPQMEVTFLPPERSRIKPSKRSLGRLIPPKQLGADGADGNTFNLLDLKISFTLADSWVGSNP